MLWELIIAYVRADEISKAITASHIHRAHTFIAFKWSHK